MASVDPTIPTFLFVLSSRCLSTWSSAVVQQGKYLLKSLDPWLHTFSMAGKWPHSNSVIPHFYHLVIFWMNSFHFFSPYNMLGMLTWAHKSFLTVFFYAQIVPSCDSGSLFQLAPVSFWCNSYSLQFLFVAVSLGYFRSFGNTKAHLVPQSFLQGSLFCCCCCCIMFACFKVKNSTSNPRSGSWGCWVLLGHTPFSRKVRDVLITPPYCF